MNGAIKREIEILIAHFRGRKFSLQSMREAN